jgi:hypothetical protein
MSGLLCYDVIQHSGPVWILVLGVTCIDARGKPNSAGVDGLFLTRYKCVMVDTFLRQAVLTFTT